MAACTLLTLVALNAQPRQTIWLEVTLTVMLSGHELNYGLSTQHTSHIFSLLTLAAYQRHMTCLYAYAGQQESKVESLESIHAARMRSHSEAGTSAQAAAEPSTAFHQPAVAQFSAPEQYGMGEQDEELDPYSLPVSHEVALEGQRLTCYMHSCLTVQHMRSITQQHCPLQQVVKATAAEC